MVGMAETMEIGDAFLDITLIQGIRRDGPLVLPWPRPGNSGGMLAISSASEWREFVLSLSLHPHIPKIVSAKYRRAQMLYFLAWLYFDLIKAGELVALTTLELALKDRYGNSVRNKRGDMRFADLLRYLEVDGLTDSQIPMVKRSGGSAIGFINGTIKPSLTHIRNSQAHGDPFDGFPCGGLLELVRDLIEYAYRDLISHYNITTPT